MKRIPSRGVWKMAMQQNTRRRPTFYPPLTMGMAALSFSTTRRAFKDTLQQLPIATLHENWKHEALSYGGSLVSILQRGYMWKTRAHGFGFARWNVALSTEWKQNMALTTYRVAFGNVSSSDMYSCARPRRVTLSC